MTLCYPAASLVKKKAKYDERIAIYVVQMTVFICIMINTTSAYFAEQDENVSSSSNAGSPIADGGGVKCRQIPFLL